MATMSDVVYTRVGDTHVAYRTLGDPGGIDLVLVAGTWFPMESLVDNRTFARLIEGLAPLGRVVLFDKRGVGASDPITDWELHPRHQWAEDLLAVIDKAGLERPIVIAWDGLGIARAAAAIRPDAVSQLVLINPAPRAEIFMAGITSAIEAEAEAEEGTDDSVGDRDGDGGVAGPWGPQARIEQVTMPGGMGDPGFREWLVRAGRLGASPATAGKLAEASFRADGPLTPDGMTTPTLALHVTDCVLPVEAVEEAIAPIDGARVVQVPGRDLFPVSGEADALLAEIVGFVTGSAHVPEPDRTLSAVLFTDLVSSTERAVDEGDGRWRDLLDAHDDIARRHVAHHAGRVVKSTGDGVLALLPSATGALRAAHAIQQDLVRDGLQIRAGVHLGEVDQRGDDVSGLVVNVAARIMGEAGPDQILASEAVRRATMGSTLRFAAPRSVELKGVPELWSISEWVP